MSDYDNIIQARSAIHYATGEMLPEGKSDDDMPWAIPTKSGPWIGAAPAGAFMATGITGGPVLERHVRRRAGTRLRYIRSVRKL